MSKIHIVREHELGMEKAREMAKKWQADGEEKLSLKCDYKESAEKDVVDIKRSGLKGELIVTANSFELNAKLGMMVAPFKDKIESSIHKSLDKLL